MLQLLFRTGSDVLDDLTVVLDGCGQLNVNLHSLGGGHLGVVDQGVLVVPDGGLAQGGDSGLSTNELECNKGVVVVVSQSVHEGLLVKEPSLALHLKPSPEAGLNGSLRLGVISSLLNNLPELLVDMSGAGDLLQSINHQVLETSNSDSILHRDGLCLLEVHLEPVVVVVVGGVGLRALASVTNVKGLQEASNEHV